MTLSEILKEKRIENQLTQEQLAEKIFVSRKTISNWETGKTTPDIDSLIRLAHLFNLSLDNLLLEGSDIVEDIKKKESAYNIQKSFAFGAQLTNILLLLFLFLPSISTYFYLSDSVYFLLLLIICSNAYTIRSLQKEVKKIKGTDIEFNGINNIGKFYMIAAFIIFAVAIIKKYLF